MKWGILGLLLVGCGNSPQPMGGKDAGVLDLEAPPSDMAATTPIGGPCTASAQCAEGTTPVCFTAKLFNKSTYLAVKSGYCSSKCTADSDCGSASTCIDFGSDGKWCMADCLAATDCRGTGYACFLRQGGYCFPSGNLNCDPTAGDGTCTTFGGIPGGCLRDAVGTGMTGNCVDGCTVGAGSCSPMSGLQRQCEVYDQSGTTDLQGQKTGDKFHGSVCIYNYASNATGSVCAALGTDGAMHDYIDACVDGDECYIPFFGGDNTCRRLCLENGGGADGGLACPAGTTCTNVFGLFGTSKPAGLCI